jgi:hypothetical protein
MTRSPDASAGARGDRGGAGSSARAPRRGPARFRRAARRKRRSARKRGRSARSSSPGEGKASPIFISADVRAAAVPQRHRKAAPRRMTGKRDAARGSQSAGARASLRRRARAAARRAPPPPYKKAPRQDCPLKKARREPRERLDLRASAGAHNACRARPPAPREGLKMPIRATAGRGRTGTERSAPNDDVGGRADAAADDFTAQRREAEGAARADAGRARRNAVLKVSRRIRAQRRADIRICSDTVHEKSEEGSRSGRRPRRRP